ncbi:hypothetical protein JQ604_35895 [Bradyrhizobium jicamae]|uniref:hypothetical protein n=1 Tax=Bradyrhizobium jicamae TaxID=280332 RepID=UPI001BA9BBD6|nr:hypothetical protein [Bradyrhizobium jicamae]MBR0757593.1 hypothetical protein [Bradyrhizobium jicamae]
MSRLPLALTAALGLLATSAAHADSKLYYGSRTGMQVTIVKTSGINGPQAVIETKHTRADATAYCRDYAHDLTAKCIDDTMHLDLRNEVRGDCTTGRFTNLYGEEFQFLGKAKARKANVSANYVIKYLKDGTIADGSSASSYAEHMEIFRKLCPAKAPSERDE